MRQNYSRWMQIPLLLLCTGFCYLLGASGWWLIGLSVSIYGLTAWALKALWPVLPRLPKPSLGGILVSALLFCAMLPVTRLTDIDRLYNLTVALGWSRSATRIINLAENALVIGLTLLFVLLGVAALWQILTRAARNNAARAETTYAAPKPPLAVILLYAAPCLVIWSIFLYAFWPGVLSRDSLQQWQQIENLRLLADNHPVGHTLLEYGLTRLWFNPAIIAIAQVLAMALVLGAALRYFEGRGFSRKALLIVSLVFGLLPYNGILLVTLWKDVPYTIVNVALIWVLGIIWLSGGTWLNRTGQVLTLGFLLAMAYLMRHNGLLVLLVVPPALLVFYHRQWKPILGTALFAAALVLGVRSGLAFGLLKAQANPPGFMYVVPIQHISAVVYYDGSYNGAHQQVMETIAPMIAWKRAYEPYFADNLTKPWGYMKDPLVLEKIGQNKDGIMRTFIDLSLSNPAIVMRSEMDLTSLLWEITTPPGYHSYDFALETIMYLPVADSSLFTNPHADSGIRSIIAHLLVASRTTPLTKDLFWRGGLYVWIAAFLAIFMMVESSWKALLIFTPMLANLLSLFLAIPAEDFRFAYPLVAPLLLLILLTLSAPPRGKKVHVLAEINE